MVAREIMSRIRRGQIYEYVSAEWVDVLCGRLRAQDANAFNQLLKRLWKPRSLAPELKAVAGKRLISEGKLSSAQVAYAIRSERQGWVRSELVGALNTNHHGKTQIETIVNEALRDANPDVSLAAAIQTANLALQVRPPARSVQPSGGKALRQFGILKRVQGRTCGITWSFARFTRRSVFVDWKRVFGSDYVHAERMAVQMRALADTNVTAFVNAADVFNDRLLDRIYGHDPSLGTYSLGRIGSVLSSTRLQAAYPAVLNLCKSIHEQRLT